MLFMSHWQAIEAAHQPQLSCVKLQLNSFVRFSNQILHCPQSKQPVPCELGPITLSESENENTTVKLLLKNHGGALRFQVHFNVVIVIFWLVNMYSNTVRILIWNQHYKLKRKSTNLLLKINFTSTNVNLRILFEILPLSGGWVVGGLSTQTGPYH